MRQISHLIDGGAATLLGDLRRRFLAVPRSANGMLLFASVFRLN